MQIHESRLPLLQAWIKEACGISDFTLTLIAGDASFRRYFRLTSAEKTYVAMDAIPTHEDNPRYALVTREFQRHGVLVPAIYQYDFDQGFLLLEDFGDRLLQYELTSENAEYNYQQAFTQLRLIQSCQSTPNWQIPLFDRNFILQELKLFYDWYLRCHLAIELSASDELMLRKTFDLLVDKALLQPTVCVHRDYHSRNLLLRDSGMGVIDHQDAVWGPVTYDLVSLLRDCYISWNVSLVDKLVTSFHQTIIADRLIENVPIDQFKEWFDWMGIQRHLKAIGIFARLKHRDNKANYLSNIPRVMKYIMDTTQRYPELRAFNSWLSDKVCPRLEIA